VLSCITIIFTCIALAQGVNINIALSANPPANTGTWGQGTAIFNITASGNMTPLINSNMLVFIKSGSNVVCGSNNPASAQSSNITNNTPKNWNGTSAAGLLGQACALPAGQYEVCVQFYGYGTPGTTQQERRLVAEKCKPFTIADKEQQQSICSPPNNINPASGKIFTENEISKTITFNWTPLVKPQATVKTYHLLVWEVEDGQSNTQAMYGNLTVIDKIITAQTRYVALPNTFEKREGLYVWRVIAEDDNGKPICDNAKSEPTNFKVTAPTKKENNDTLNTKCGNGDFETGKLDPTEWSGGFTKIVFGNNSLYAAPFNNIIQPTNGLPLDAPLGAGCGNQANENHHVIVTAGADPTVPMLQRVPPSTITNNYALRLGNNCKGYGAEKIKKKFLVAPNDKELKFMYALVFEAPHSFTSNPSLWVKVYDATNTLVPNIVYLDPLNPLPMDRAVSDLNNPYWNTYYSNPQDSSKLVLWRDWACARIDLSGLAGQIITVEIITNDCAFGAHYGYGYVDNFCIGCDNNPTKKDCCTEEIKIKSDKITVAADNLNIQQEFNFSPKNITNVVAEIVYVEEENMDPACMDCTKFLNSPFHFVSANTAKWGSAAPHKASPSNSTAKYPSKIIKWATNKQGNVKFDFNIGLPGTIPGSTCKHKGKICIRYVFTDADCKVCEKMICYTY
jgi:hypothetical protein